MKWWPWIVIAAAVLMSKKSTRSPGNWSQDFSLEEFISPGDRATIPQEYVSNLQALVANVLQPARTKLGLPIRINSAYRNPQKNAAIGGVPNSQHITGQAADIAPVPATLENYKKLWDILVAGNYDQVIWERAKAFTGKPSHLHVSYNPGNNRKKKLQYLNGSYSYI